jgi:uncharacterized protein YbjT (DUF2867 family)
VNIGPCGIVPAGPRLSRHLASRAEVGELLMASGVPTVELRAAIILGSGSASFEMLRYLTERLPVMVTPRWVRNRVQPIAVRDVLHYLTRAAALPSEVSRGFDIGGPDVLTYLDMMRRYAAVTGLPRRVVVPVPVLTPWLSAQWVNLVTPVPRNWRAISPFHAVIFGGMARNITGSAERAGGPVPVSPTEPR